MSEVTLKIPEKQLRPFREAAVREAKYCGAWVARAAEEQLRRGHEGTPKLADIRSACAHLAAVVTVLERLAGADGDVEVRAEADVLAHIAEGVAKRIQPKLEDELSVVYNAELVAKVHRMTESIEWADTEATRLHAIAQAEIRAEKARS